MTKPVPHQLLQDIDCYTRMFRQYPWELTITSRIPAHISTEEAHELFINQILAPLSATLKQKISSLSIVVPKTKSAPAHIHALVLTFEGNLPRRDHEIQAFILDNIGSCSMLPDTDACIIKPITTLDYFKNATAYAAKNFASVTGATLNPYKKRLLLKMRGVKHAFCN